MWTQLSGIAGALGVSSQLASNQLSTQTALYQAAYQNIYQTTPPDYTMCECNEVPDPDTQQTFYSFRIPLNEREDYFELNEILHGFEPDDYILKSSVANSWGDSRLALFVFNDLLAVHLKLKYMGI